MIIMRKKAYTNFTEQHPLRLDWNDMCVNNLTFYSRMIIITVSATNMHHSVIMIWNVILESQTCNKLTTAIHMLSIWTKHINMLSIVIKLLSIAYSCLYLNWMFIYSLKIYNIYQTIVANEIIKSGFLWLWRNHSWNKKNHRNIKIENNAS